MHERKALMAELSDAFIALPGGIGTLEELFEVYTWAQLGIHSKPLGLIDVAGYYQPLVAFLDHAVQERFLRPETRTLLAVSDGPRRPAGDTRDLGAAHRPQVDRPRPDVTAVFDGHNDVLGKLQAEGGATADFLTGLPDHDVDLPRARAGGLGGAMFAINAALPARPVVRRVAVGHALRRPGRARDGRGLHGGGHRARPRAGGGRATARWPS